MRDYMFVSLYIELVFLRYREFDFQSDEDSRRSTSRYAYFLSGFYYF